MKRTDLGGKALSLIWDKWSLRMYGSQSGDVLETLGYLSQ